MAPAPGYLDDPRFSRTFELPADPANGRGSPFKLTYADFGHRDETTPEEENVFLFFGTLMGSRLIHVAKHEMAKRHKIRFINVDRPGIGGTDAVAAEDSVELWRGTSPAEDHTCEPWSMSWELTMNRGHTSAPPTPWDTTCLFRLP